MFMFRLKTATLSIVAAAPWLAAQMMAIDNAEATETPSASSGYTVVKDGHLSRDGARQRLWGVNVDTSYFRTYEEIDRLVVRLKALGFNSVRLWPGIATFYVPSKDKTGNPVTALPKRGDGSNLDRFDYFVYKASAAGLSLDMTALHYFDLPTLRAMKAPAVASWVSAAKDDAQLRVLNTFAPYVSEGYRAMIETHIDEVLKRVNPYTGRPYSDEPSVSTWELANESRFVECSLAAKCLESLPLVAREQLSALWERSPLNAAHTPLPDAISQLLSSPNASAYRRFVSETFIAASNEMRTRAREDGTPGRGVAIQPFVFTTGPAEPNAIAHYSYGKGDALSIGWYRSPLQRNGLDGSPWQPASVAGPQAGFPWMMKLKDKPLIVYETSFFRPMPFRAEWGPLMLGMALQQDWDAVYLYQYGQPKFIYADGGRPEDYGQVPIPEPVANDPNPGKASYTYGFHQGADPTAMASWSVAAMQFVSVATTTPAHHVWDIALDEMFNSGDYPPGFSAQIGNAALADSVAIEFEQGSVRHCTPCVAPTAKKDWAVMWPTGARPLTIETPSGVSFTGRLRGMLGNFDGLSLQVEQPEFGVAALLCQAGCSSSLHSMIAVLAGNDTNTGMVFDPTAVDFSSPIGAFRGTMNGGGLPIRYSGPSVLLKSDNGKRRFEAENFGLLPASDPKIADVFTVDARSGLFRVLITTPE